MPPIDALRQSDPQADAHDASAGDCQPLQQLLQRRFGVRFALLDGLTGDLLCAGEQPALDWMVLAELVREVARRGQPEFIDDDDPFLVLAIPLEDEHGNPLVAAGAFITRPLEPEDCASRGERRVGVQVDEALRWAAGQVPCLPQTVHEIAQLVLHQSRVEQRAKKAEAEATNLSVHLARVYEEICLLHRLVQNLRSSASDEDLGRIALEWMQETVPAAGLAMQMAPLSQGEASLGQEARSRPVWLTNGDCPLDSEEFMVLLEHVGCSARNEPIVVNREISGKPEWPWPRVRQMIIVSLAEGDNVFGYLTAMNHVEDQEFGTVEASLLGSVAAILGIRGGDVDLCREQSELLAGVVRALTSAIDAKDPYTHGHTDRVAQIAVRLAEQLGCDSKTLNTIYLSGLLHDIGKIGIDDGILHKPGKLSEEEYEHIKQHAEIGHRILRDLRRLEDVLPVVMHHHESWDGAGYPKALSGEQIPLAARIVAVADAFDAMSSDRPYRQRLSDEKIDAIFRDGAGGQWDPNVVDALFRIRDDIRKITSERNRGIAIDFSQWK